MREMKITCKKCNEKKEPEQFQWIVRGKNKRLVLNSRTCRTCTNHNKNVVARLKKHNPKPIDSKCKSCGKETQLVCDHNHNTDTFRGWLCESCNTGIGKLGDDADGVRMALNYLESTTQNESKNIINKSINPKPNKMENLNLIRAFVDAGDLTYAMKVFNLSTNTPSKVNITPINTSGLPESERLKVRTQFRNENLKPYDASKNLQPASNVFGVTKGASLINRCDEYWNLMAESGSMYETPKGTKTEFYVDVDLVPSSLLN